jgi:hypothetical protein
MLSKYEHSERSRAISQIHELIVTKAYKVCSLTSTVYMGHNLCISSHCQLE